MIPHQLQAIQDRSQDKQSADPTRPGLSDAALQRLAGTRWGGADGLCDGLYDGLCSTSDRARTILGRQLKRGKFLLRRGKPCENFEAIIGRGLDRRRFLGGNRWRNWRHWPGRSRRWNRRCRDWRRHRRLNWLGRWRNRRRRRYWRRWHRLNGLNRLNWLRGGSGFKSVQTRFETRETLFEPLNHFTQFTHHFTIRLCGHRRPSQVVPLIAGHLTRPP